MNPQAIFCLNVDCPARLRSNTIYHLSSPTLFGRDTTKAGIPTAQLQDLLGHTSMEVTKIYTQFNSAELQEAHDRYSPVEGDIDVPPSLDSHTPNRADEEKQIDQLKPNGDESTCQV